MRYHRPRLRLWLAEFYERAETVMLVRGTHEGRLDSAPPSFFDFFRLRMTRFGAALLRAGIAAVGGYYPE
jgi:hypothetical protein